MTKRLKCIFASLLATLLIAVAALAPAASAYATDTVDATIEVTYSQTSARSMLDMINELRTGDDAWYYDSSGNVVTVSGLSELTYDYTLEAMAMQRAAEIALSFSHTRTDGSSCFTIYTDYGVSIYSAGENIAAGYSSASAAFTGWAEEDEDYSGQGHRRNMLSSSYTSIGIGHVVFNGTHYWVQVLAKPVSTNTTATTANDSTTSVDVQIATSYISSYSLTASSSSVSVSQGGTAAAPTVTEKIQLTSSWPASKKTITTSYSYSMANTSIATVNSGGTITGVSGGTTTLTISTGYGASASVGVTVACSSHTYGSWTTTTKATTSSNGTRTRTCSVCGTTSTSTIKKISSVKLSSTSYTYNGKTKKPSVTVKDSGGNTLTNGTDYTVSYASGRKNVGTYKVKVTFKGKYSGTKTLTFKIKPASTSISKLTAAKKAFTVKWSKKSTQVTGYQIMYSTSSSFSSYKTTTISSYKTTSKKISGLKSKKTYYVKIRTYKTVNGTKYYSSWSSVKKFKTK